jgi:predicted methyltransferase
MILPGLKSLAPGLVLPLIALLAWPLNAPAATTGADPAINQAFQDTDVQNWIDIFERPGREIYDQRAVILGALGIQAGMKIADIGAGTGLFTRLLARATGKTGIVYAVDISAPFIDNIKRMRKELGLLNIVAINNTPKSTGLANRSIDLAFICDTYHHFEFPRDTLASVHTALRNNGQLVIIDFKKVPGISSDWVMRHVRADQQSVVREIESAGFKLVEQIDLLQYNYFLRFRKIQHH